jgi:hypothetical protein
MTPEHKKEVLDFISEVLDGRGWRYDAADKWITFPDAPDIRGLVGNFSYYELKPKVRMLQLWSHPKNNTRHWPGTHYAFEVGSPAEMSISSHQDYWVKVGDPFPHPEDVEQTP